MAQLKHRKWGRCWQHQIRARRNTFFVDCDDPAVRFITEQAFSVSFHIVSVSVKLAAKKHDRLPVPIPRLECSHSPCSISTCQRCHCMLSTCQCVAILEAGKAKPKSKPSGKRPVVQQCQRQFQTLIDRESQQKNINKQRIMSWQVFNPQLSTVQKAPELRCHGYECQSHPTSFVPRWPDGMTFSN